MWFKFPSLHRYYIKDVTNSEQNIPFLRSVDSHFDALKDFPFVPRYFDNESLRMHYVDEGAKDAPIALMIHGMPTWSYLYRFMIPPFVKAGFRCIAPDHIGFGRSDKVITPEWYNIAQHTENLSRLIEALDLRDITLFVQDWGGPIGLAQFANMPERFSRIIIMNTWLHHDGYEYSPGIQQWIQQNSLGGIFRDNVPSKFNWGTLMAMSTQRVSPQDSLFKIMNGEKAQLSPEAIAVQDAYDAPFADLGDSGVTGPRRFPLSIPFHDPISGNADEQQKHFQLVNQTSLPVHFVWGVNDQVFTRDWGKKWHELIPQSTWHEINASHFLQDTHGAEISAHILSQIK